MKKTTIKILFMIFMGIVWFLLNYKGAFRESGPDRNNVFVSYFFIVLWFFYLLKNRDNTAIVLTSFFISLYHVIVIPLYWKYDFGGVFSWDIIPKISKPCWVLFCGLSDEFNILWKTGMEPGYYVSLTFTGMALFFILKKLIRNCIVIRFSKEKIQ